MLLLVLILVLIAFGLLVVALLTGSVMWAWVSVGVSVVAAVVLLIDWLQRRSAVKAGVETTATVAEPRRATAHVADVESVTEVLPVIPRSGAVPGAGPAAEAHQQDRPDLRFAQAADAQQTIVMPVVQPPASAGRPPGASPDTTSSGGDPSQTVTKSGSDRSSEAPPHDTPGSTAEPGGAPESRPAEDPTSGAQSSPPAAPTAGGVAPESTGAAPPGIGRMSAAAATTAATTAAAAAKAEPTTGTPAVADPTAAEPTSNEPRAAEAGEAEEPVASSGGESPAQEAPAAAESAGTAESTAGAQEPSADAPSDTGSGASAAEATGARPDREPAADGEPPEETRDPTASALVAGLEAEVLVIDEQPRYHLASCRALAGKQLIPLPVREAVELGFTPCGWCSPNRTLVGQHAPAR